MSNTEDSNKNFSDGGEGQMTNADCLNRIFKKIDEVGFCPESVTELKDDILFVTGRFGIGERAAVLISCILEESSNKCDDNDISAFLGCTNIEFIKFKAVLAEIEDRGIIEIERDGRCRYDITMEALKAIESDSDYVPPKYDGLKGDELFVRFRQCFRAYRKHTLAASTLSKRLERYIESNNKLEFCRKILESAAFLPDCAEYERRVFIYLCHRYVSHGNASVPIRYIMDFIDDFEEEDKLRDDIKKQNTILQTSGLVTFGINDGFTDEDELSLSDEVKAGFFNEVHVSPEEEIKHKDIILSENIKAKELFYNEGEDRQISRLCSLLDEMNFKGIQERLEQKGMRKGFNAIFYGGPGTGKTACVYELARRTGRDVFCVDMSKLKSKWVGDSEKSVKGLFDMYREICRKNEKAPILLFNEADAIFSKRMTNVERSVDQMYNSIQNIILNEMENLEGILIATTNMTCNLDKAFERRFIFKIEFNTPDRESRKKIWKSVLGDLTEDDAAVLAGKYDFSGGNIENVARKSTVDYVLSGHNPDLDSLIQLCEEERMEKKKRDRIGFVVEPR